MREMSRNKPLLLPKKQTTFVIYNCLCILIDFVLEYREKDSRKTTLIVATSVFAFLTLLNTSKGLTPLQPTVVWLVLSTSSGPHLPVQVPVAKLLVWPSTLIPPLLLHHDPQRFISHARPGYVFSTAMVR